MPTSDEGGKRDGGGEDHHSPMIVHDAFMTESFERSVRKMSQESSNEKEGVEEEETEAGQRESEDKDNEVATPQRIKRQRLGSAGDFTLEEDKKARLGKEGNGELVQ